MRKYLVVIEQTEGGHSAYSPDLPGSVSTGKTREETERNLCEAMQFHIDGLKQAGKPVPEAQASSSYVEPPT